MEIVRQGGGVVRMQSNLHIGEVEELRTVLMGELAVAPALELELSGVENCDTAGFQLLCSLRKSAEQAAKELHISAFPAAMREASATIGLSLEDLTNLPKN
jgi:ABC-type transporter Mla MlaB component